MSKAPFHTPEELAAEFPRLKREKKLHPLVEARLATLLQDIWPDAYAKPEPGEMPAGRSDLAFYFADGRYAVFEIFATVSQVPQDLRHLEQSNAQARIAILTDPSLDDGAIYDEYYGRRARDPFPALKLSEILVGDAEAAGMRKLKDLIDRALVADQDISQPHEPLASRLAELSIDDVTRHDFGSNLFTWHVARRDGRLVIIAALPVGMLGCPAAAVLRKAASMLDDGNWATPTPEGLDALPPRYWPQKIFKVPRTRRSAGDALFWEDAPADSATAYSRLVVTNRAEVIFASSAGAQFVTRLVDRTGVFRLGRIIAVLWELSGLVAQLYREIGHAGQAYLCVALLGTKGTLLGAFADDYPDPIEEQYWPWDILPDRDWTCHAKNVKYCQTVDILAMQPRQVPRFVRDFAEAISLAYNHDEPRCFDKQTGCIPAHYFDQY
jgi:hypothetical protein